MQELGIDLPDTQNIKYLTRLHYWAADKVTHGENTTWGEHEIDYILFCKMNDIRYNLNKEEVEGIKFVTFEELRQMMLPASGLLWSPWFRIIAEKFLVHWWKDLEFTLFTDKYVDYDNIYRFDPGKEHFGGAGNAGQWLGNAKYLE